MAQRMNRFMMYQKKTSSGVKRSKIRLLGALCRFVRSLFVLLGAGLAPALLASENVPHRPFAMWADIPHPSEFIVGAVYEESEAYRIWTGHTSHNVTTHADGEDYGIDVTQGYVSVQYGIIENWAADLTFGATTVGWRFFDNGAVQSTTGIMDTSFGIRYQIFNEAQGGSAWLPTLTFRAGAVIPGSFNESLAFAPGTRSAAIEPEFLLRKHLGS